MARRGGRLAAIAAVLGWAALGGTAAGQQTPGEVIPLWPAGAPGAVGQEAADVPTLTLFRPPAEKANGAMVIICPGGGYGMLAVNHEGDGPAKWLNDLGVTAGVLRYRIAPKYRHPAPLQDAQRAIRLARARAADWGIDPKRVGILGFSAGGHLASTAATHFDAGNPDAADPIDRQGCRPDVVLLGYPVIAMATEYGHAGSKRNLLGETPDPALVESLSNERAVTRETPPAFLVQTNEDTGVVAENSLLFVLALRKAGVPVEFHLFEKGKHGLGLGGGEPKYNVPPDPAFSAWPALAATWLKGRGFLDKAK
jgi:acetyl esterase/lipase